MNLWRKEIQDFSKTCEKLLSHCLAPGEKPLSEEERELLGYYLYELKRLAMPIDTTPRS